MSFPPPARSIVKKFPTRTSRDGPAVHEDLTIAEHLETMRISNEHRLGALCFVNGKGDKRWFAEGEVKTFLAIHGAEHPSDFKAASGTDWQDAFFDRS